MGERAQYNAGKMTKGEFLEAISGPYQHAFTPENIKRAFEITGTWPIDQTKITAEATAPSEGLSFKSGPIVSLNSPVKKLVQVLDTHAHRNTSVGLPSPSSGLPSPSSQDLDLPPSIPPSPSTESLDSIIDSLGETHAAFLFDGSPVSSANVVQTIDLHLPTFPKLSDASSKPPKPHQLDAMTKAELVTLVQQLGDDVQLLIQHSHSAEDVAAPAIARLALMTLELRQQRTALHLKEQQKKTTRGRLFPGGRGVESTGDLFMNEQLLTMNEREQQTVEEAQKRADNMAHKKVYAEAMAKWKERRQAFRDAGLPMARAGNKPLLYQIKAGNYSAPSNILSDLEENALNIQGRRRRQHNVAMNSIPGEEVDIDNTDSGEASDAWSAHDESDDLST